MNGDAIYFHRNRGDGTFEQRTISSTVNGPRAIAFADVDGDGDLDLLVGAYLGTLRYWERLADGSLHQLTGTASPFQGIDVDRNAAPATG